jgi:L-asparaginase
MNDEIHAEASVRKTHSTSTAAFQSPNTGPAGLLVEGSPRWFSGPPVRHTVRGAQGGGRSRAPRVVLHTITLNDDPDLLAGIHTRADGLIVAGMGAGHVPHTFVDVLGQTATRIPTVLTTRTGRGPCLTQTYGFSGSERDLLWRGLISGGFLDPLKARILLHALLTAGANRSEIVEAFTAAGNG